MLTIKDIVELAKAGYKPGDVKELMEISKSNDDVTSDRAAPDSTNTQTPVIPMIDSLTPTTGAATEDTEDDIDYKKLYEDTKNELAKAQKENRNKDISSEDDNKTDKDILEDLFKEFM